MTDLPTTLKPTPLLPAFRILFPLGVVAVLALLPSLPGLLAPALARTPDAPPMTLLVALSAVQLTVYVALATLGGAWAAPRVGFRSRLVERDWTALRRDLIGGILPGVLVGAALVLLDTLSAPLLGDAWAKAAAEQPRGFTITLSGMLYGGIGEELQMRWALVSILTLGLWKLLDRRAARPRPAVIWTAIAVVAVVFGVAHLGTVALMAPLTPLLVTRTVLLNAVGGLVFGWLFTHRSLESAMSAHAFAHVSMTALSLLT